MDILNNISDIHQIDCSSSPEKLPSFDLWTAYMDQQHRHVLLSHPLLIFRKVSKFPFQDRY